MADLINGGEAAALIIEPQNGESPEDEKKEKQKKKPSDAKYSFLTGQTVICIAILIILLVFKMTGGGFYTELLKKYRNTFCKSLSPSEVAETVSRSFKYYIQKADEEKAEDGFKGQGKEGTGETEDIALFQSSMEGAFADNISGDAQAFEAAGVSIENRLFWPCRGRISDYFGLRTDSFDGVASYHKGIDIAVRTGTQVHASLGGRVTISRLDPTYGNYIVITHSEGIKTLYAHLDERLVNAGDTVTANSVIALSGNTGNSTGPHLHFEILMGGKNRIDPLALLPDD